jgi:hemerythrin-like metal-binding protein
MPILNWTPSLSVNVEVIDTQHKKMFELANIFYRELYDGADKTVLIEKLKELVEYSIFHFKTEEDLLQKANHPSLETHAKEHEQFVEELTALNSRILAGDLVISVEIISFLRNAIINHIFVSDKEMGKHYNQ